MPAINPLERVADLADAGTCARRSEGELEQVAFAALRALGQRVEAALRRCPVAIAAQRLQALDLCVEHSAVVDSEQRDLELIIATKLVHANDGLLRGVDARLRARCHLFDAKLRQ